MILKSINLIITWGKKTYMRKKGFDQFIKIKKKKSSIQIFI